jgi:dTMP kinase
MAHEFPGVLIAIEGIDGSGKSTAACALHKALKDDCFSVVLTKEPGDTLLGKHVRLLVNEHAGAIRPEAEFLLFAADRAQHMHEVVRPALLRGDIVISDRLHYSSECYQGAGRQLDLDIIKRVNTWVMHDIVPDIVIYIKIGVQKAFERIQLRGEGRTLFEYEDFIERVSKAFDDLFVQQVSTTIKKTKIIVVDGEQECAIVVNQVYCAVRDWLKNKRTY